MRLSPIVPALILTTACSPAGGGDGASNGDSAAAGAPGSERAVADSLPAMRALGALTAPSSWSGPLGSTITLFPDGTVRRRDVTSSGRGADTVVDHGRWTLADREARITLFGAGAPQRFALEDTATWRALDVADAARADGASTWHAVGSVDSVLDAAAMHGAFVYYADAAILTECASGRQYPVAMTGAYRELETRYGASGAAGGSPAVVRIRARLADAPVGEGDGRATAVFVEGVERVEAEGACAALELRRAVDGVEWQLTELGGEPLDPATPGEARRSTLQFALSESQIAGRDGCNRYSGRGVLRGVDLVVLGPLAVTRMMCADSLVMARAERFTRALGEGGWLRLDGATLVLSRGPRVVARFVAAQR